MERELRELWEEGSLPYSGQAERHERIVEQLLDEGANANAQDKEYGDALQETEEMYRRKLAVKENALGPDHPDALETARDMILAVST